MSRLTALVVVELKNHFSPLLFLRQLKFGLQRRRVLLLTVVIIACLLPLFFTLLQGLHWLHATLQAIGQQSAIVAMAVIAGQVLLFLFGFFYVISAFYFSRDLGLLIPLPLRPREVLFSRLAIVVSNEALMTAPVVLPLLVGYGILDHAPVGYWVMLLPVYLLLPVLPLCLAGLLAMGLMRVVNLSRRKDAFVVVGTLALIAVQLFIQLRARGATEDAQAVLRIMTDEDGLVRMIGRNFPPSVWATRSLTQAFSFGGLGEFAKLAGVSLLAFAGLLALAEKLFYQGAIGLSEVSARRKAMAGSELERRISSGSHPLRATFLREWRLMNRTPIFFLNGVLVVVIVPAVLLVMMSAGSSDPFVSILANLGNRHATAVILGLTAFFLVCGCLNGTASSAFSREGKHFWISKTIPVAWRTQIAAKLLHAWLIAVLGAFTAALVAYVKLKVSVPVILAAYLLAAAAALLLTLLALRIDLARPRLQWTNPQVAIKQNWNVFLAMVVQFGILGVFGFVAHFVLQAGIPGTGLYVALLAIALAGSWALWREIGRFADERYPEIEG